MGSYRLPDEPRPGAWSHLVVAPQWPLFAVMFAGPWLSWPWFVFNAWALGSPTKVKEAAIAVGGFVGSLAILLALILVSVGLGLPKGAMPYLLVLHVVWEIGIAYILAEMQGQGFALYSWYGGPSRNGMGVVVVGFLLRPMLAARVGGFFGLVLL